MKRPSEYIKTAYRIYFKKKNFIFFAKIMAVLTIVTTATSYIHTYVSQFVLSPDPVRFNFNNVPLTVAFFLLALFSFIFYFYSQVTTYLSVINVGMSEKAIFKLGYKNMWRFFVISFVIGLIIIFGVVFFLIPVLIFGVWYSFSIFLFLDKGLGVKESLKQSKALVKGKFWAVLGQNLVFGLFGLLIGFIFSLMPYKISPILTSFFLPLFILPRYLLYKDLVSDVRD